MRPEDRRDHPEIYSVPTEETVPNEARALPSDRWTVFIISVIVAVLVVVGIILAFASDIEIAGLVVALIALVLGIIGIIMAYGDARVSTTTPTLATIGAGILTLATVFTILGADRSREMDLAPVLGIETAATDPPADPAEIINPDPNEDLPRDAEPRVAAETQQPTPPPAPQPTPAPAEQP
jgi:hypothetical protein